MNNGEWKKIQTQIKDSLINNREFKLETMEEPHKGAFLAVLTRKGELIAEVKKTQDGLTELNETISELVKEMMERNIEKEVIQDSLIQLCVIKEVIFLKNPLDWKPESEGVCFQWGNRYKSFMMPYEASRIGGDKIRLLDRLCSHKAGMPSSMWRLPCGICFRILIKHYK